MTSCSHIHTHTHTHTQNTRARACVCVCMCIYIKLKRQRFSKMCSRCITVLQINSFRHTSSNDRITGLVMLNSKGSTLKHKKCTLPSLPLISVYKYVIISFRYCLARFCGRNHDMLFNIFPRHTMSNYLMILKSNLHFPRHFAS